MNDILAAALWWLAIQFLGLIAWPLTFRLFRRLPDRGYALSKAMGVLLVTYLFWLLGSLGLLRNTVGGILMSAALVALLAAWVYRRPCTRDPADLPGWVAAHRRYVLAVELLFALSFALWCLVRAHNPEITGTEKPMDLAFIQAILRSETFPPVDPWLSGHAISYYYFGYVMHAMMAKLTGVPGTVAFNLGLAWQFAGTVLGGFGLVYNLVSAEVGSRGKPVTLGRVGAGLLGGVMVAVMGNLEGFLEVLHARAWLPTGFWRWLDIEEINLAPVVSSPWWPPRGGWWWWRASRVLHDRGLSGESLGLQPIAEFPAFSFVLGDMHPHMMALPYVLLGLGLALNWWLTSWQRESTVGRPLWASIRELVSVADPVHVGLYAVCLGALAFLNTWDFPSLLAIAVGSMTLAVIRDRPAPAANTPASGLVAETALLGAVTLVSIVLVGRRLLGGESAWLPALAPVTLTPATWWLFRLAQQQKERSGQWQLGVMGELLVAAVGLGLAGILAYVPFYLGFRSQAAGLLPNVINPTRLPQFVVMFGPFLLVLLVWLFGLLPTGRANWSVGLCITGGLLLALVVAVALFGALAALTPTAQGWIAQVTGDVGGLDSAVRLTLIRRLTNPWTALLLLAMIASAIALSYPLVLNRRSAPAEAGQWARTVGPPVASTLEPVSVASFVLLLVLAASLLTLAPEFVYLKDVFQGRMNTVFKFYYLAWVLLAVSSGYALHGLLRRAGWVRWVGGLGGALLIAAGLFYPVLAVATRTAGRGGSATLDGMAYMENSQPADYAAIRWLQENVEGTPLILEAVGGQYSWGARISAHTGLPTVLGWAGHEQQWRGDTHEPGLREPDVRTMYTSRVWPEVQALLEKYQVEYVVVGPLEISTYGQVAAAKFERVLDAVFQGDGVVIYRWHRLIQP